MADRRSRLIILLLVGFVLVSSSVSFAAGTQENTADIDALYAAAAAAAQSGDRGEARRLAVEVLVLAPGYADATVLLARLDGWEGRYAPARDALTRVIEAQPNHYGARKALVDVEYWSGDHERAAELCAETRRLLPDDEELRTRCAQVVRASTVESAEAAVAARPRSGTPTTKPEETAAATYRTSVDYTNQSFDDDLDSWHTVSLASERRDERVALIGRASYVNRFNESMLQLDAEAYPVLGEKTYAHLLTSYATGDILHDFKLWAEIYQGLTADMEGSLGVRWSVYKDDVIGVTGTLGRYWKSWFFQGRFLIDTVSGEATGSGSLRARYTFDDPEESLTGTVGFGKSFEQEEDDASNVRLFEIETTSMFLHWRKRLSKRYIAKIGVGTEFQDLEGDDRTQFVAGVGLEHLF